VKDDIRGEFLPARLVETPGTQRIPQCSCGGVELGSICSGFAVTQAARPGNALISAKAHRFGAAQDLGGGGRERETP